jgi:membrane-associated phospholipid phosphatase
VIAALALGAFVLFGRIYVGAHLPLDVVGGAALGALAGGVVNLIVRPRPHPADSVARNDVSEPNPA